VGLRYDWGHGGMGLWAVEELCGVTGVLVVLFVLMSRAGSLLALRSCPPRPLSPPVTRPSCVRLRGAGGSGVRGAVRPGLEGVLRPAWAGRLYTSQMHSAVRLACLCCGWE
jgi:hypothetical protein